jgi:hypothetical protein
MEDSSHDWIKAGAGVETVSSQDTIADAFIQWCDERTIMAARIDNRGGSTHHSRETKKMVNMAKGCLEFCKAKMRLEVLC